MLLPGVTPGLIALIAALVVAAAGGTAWQRLNGRMRAPRAARPPEAAVARAATAVAPATTVAAAASAPTVTLEAADPAMPPDTADAGVRLTSDELGHALGERATLVQFSTAFCAPCRATRRVLDDVAGMVQGVAHVEIDAESRLDLVRQLNVLRTPTVLVLAADGRIVRRASGQPRKPDVIAAIGVAVEGAASGAAG
jgi:thiol-disulfide isomerase/thioredoxin